MFLDILEFRIRTEKSLSGKTVLKIWSQICGKKTYVSTKLLLEKSAKNIKQFIIFGR